MSDLYLLKKPDIGDFEMRHSFNDDPCSDAFSFPPHIHSDLEIYVLVEGNVSFMVEQKLYPLSPGDAIVSKPNEIHNCIVNAASAHKYYCFWFSPSSELLFGTFLQHKLGEGNLISLPPEKKRGFMQTCASLHEAAEKNDSLLEFCHALRFLYILQQHPAEKGRTQSLPRLLQNILHDINDNFKYICELEYFTHKYFISQSTLQRLFRKHLHTSPKLYLEAKKLAYSRTLLQQNFSVAEACEAAGFTDYSNYIRLFKKRFGVTPKQYSEMK